MTGGRTLLTIIAFASVAVHLAAQDPLAQTAREKLIITQQLARMGTGDLKATVIQVHYGPDERSIAHSHGCPVIVYVLNGTLRTQIKGRPVEYYGAGKAFYEAANAVHLISANASSIEPANFLAFFICEPGAQLSTPVKENSK